MPDFDDVEITAEVTVKGSVAFEVYCGNCGAGICHGASTMRTRTRGMARVDVEPCEKCVAQSRLEVKEEMQGEIDDLKKQIKSLTKE